MKKWIIIMVSSFLILFTVLLFNSAGFLKKPLTGEDNFILALSQIQSEVEKDNWNEANSFLEQADYAWEKVKNRIQFSVERTFLDDIDNELATIKGAIKSKDFSMLIISLEKIRFLWSIL